MVDVIAADSDGIARTASVLRAGDLAAFPTETVYGLGGDACDGRAVRRIFAAKGRPAHNPLIVHVADTTAATELGCLDDRARSLAAAFWPGGLTVVVPRASECPAAELVSGGLETIALRVPSHPVARRVLELSGLAIAAPSANRSGGLSPTQAAHVRESLGGSCPHLKVVLDGGACPVGVESTVIGCLPGEPARLLRPGAITRTRIESALGGAVVAAQGEGSEGSPGRLGPHYAPSSPLRVNATSVHPGERLLAFGRDVPAGAAAVLNLSPSGDVAEAAANLYACLAALDSMESDGGIAVMPIPAAGLGEAINDRLQRAAA